MDRTNMDADHGMLFVFDEDAMRAFWMKNTKIPLDMLFFNGDRKLVSIQRTRAAVHEQSVPCLFERRAGALRARAQRRRIGKAGSDVGRSD